MNATVRTALSSFFMRGVGVADAEARRHPKNPLLCCLQRSFASTFMFKQTSYTFQIKSSPNIAIALTGKTKLCTCFCEKGSFYFTSSDHLILDLNLVLWIIKGVSFKNSCSDVIRVWIPLCLVLILFYKELLALYSVCIIIPFI
jgi:hypothetical protein